MTGLHILSIIFWIVWGVCAGTIHERNKGTAMTSDDLTLFFYVSLALAVLFSFIAAIPS